MARQRLVFSALMLTLIWCIAARAAPAVIRYQGRLTNGAGQAVTTPTSVTFSFYATDSGGSPLAGYSDTHSVTPNGDGIYSTEIGSLPPGAGIPAEVFASEPVYLNVNVGGEDLSPRMLVTSSAYALNAQTVAGYGVSQLQLGARSFTTAESVTAGDLVALDSAGLLHKAQIPEVTTSALPTASVMLALAMLDSVHGVLAYYDGNNNGYCTAVVITLEGDAISYGTPVVVDGAGVANAVAACRLADDKVLIVTNDSSRASLAVAATVSGTDLTLGTPASFGTDNMYSSITATALGLDRAYFAYYDGDYGGVHGRIANCSGTALTLGDPYVVSGGDGAPLVSTLVDTDKVLMAYPNSLWVASISGNTISYGSIYDAPVTSYRQALATLGTGKALAVLSGDNGAASVATVNGTEVAFGPVAYYVWASNMAVTGGAAGVVTLNPQKALIFYGDGLNFGGGVGVVANIDDDQIAYEAYARFDPAYNAIDCAAAALDGERAILVYPGSGYTLTTAIFTSPANGLGEYIGVAEETVEAAAACRVTVNGGVTEQFESLIPGKIYYVAGSRPSLVPASSDKVVAGQALSASQFMVQH